MTDLSFTKLYSEADFQHPSMETPLEMLRLTMDKLESRGLLDPLPVEARKWEYAQGIRAFLQAKREGGGSIRVLEIGGSTSCFLPAIAYVCWGLGAKVELTSVESPEWSTEPNLARQRAQIEAVVGPQPIRQLTEIPHFEQFDFISCISVIENLPYSGSKVPNYAPPDDDWHDGHSYMLDFLSAAGRRLAPRGILFFTSDCIEKQPDEGIMFCWQRPPGAWCPATWQELDWRLTDSPKVELESLDTEYQPPAFTPNVYNAYTFASSALRRV